MKTRTHLLILLLLMLALQAGAAPPALILVDTELPGADRILCEEISRTVKAAGYAPKPVTVEQLMVPGALAAQKCELLALPQARSLPTALAPVVEAYLRTGGNLLALGAPAWCNPLVRGADGKWVSISSYGEKRALEDPGRIVFDFSNALTGWERSSDHTDARAEYDTISTEAVGKTTRAFHALVSNLQGWDTIGSPVKPGIFAQGETVTAFSAKGDSKTRALAVEWEEKDGARWIATVPLTEKWQRYSLPPAAFKLWSNPTGRPVTELTTANVVRLKVGLAYTHTGQMSGRHEYWISPIGLSTGANAGPDLEAEKARVIPVDTLAPQYKFFPMQGPLTLRTTGVGGGFTAVSVPANLALLSSSPRPQGAGYNKGRNWRWIPVLQAYSAEGYWRGCPATLMMHGPGSPYAGGAWLVFAGTQNTPENEAGDKAANDWYHSSPTLQLIQQQLQRVRAGAFLLEGGAEFFACERGDLVKLGLKAAVHGKPEGQLSFHLEMKDGAGNVMLQLGGEMNPAPNGMADHESRWEAPQNWPTGGYRLEAQLLLDGKLIDKTTHSLTLYSPPQTQEFVQRKPDGHFYLNGKRWRINGINYLPSSGVAQEDPHIFEHWLSKEAYDPEVVERDLTHIENLGMNAVSIFVYRESLDSHNLLDMLKRCRAHHLKVNLSLRPGVLDSLHATPPRTYPEAMAAAIENFTTIIKRYHLDRDDSIFAYETAWEPNFGSQQVRTQMDGQWSEWLTAKYRDIKLAEGAWNHKVPRDASGKITGVTTAQLAGDEPGALRMVADYRRFLDSWLNVTYGSATAAIKKVAPAQMVSFRMASAGFPGDDQRGDLPYQLEGLTSAVDFLSPECYGRVGSAEGELGILFEAAYARAVGPTMPVIWAEVGFTAWDPGAQQDDPGAIDFQGKYLDTFYRLAVQSGMDGIFFWWYPGGYRTGENSDFGIINPDGTDRPATLAIRKWGPLLLNAPDPAPASMVLEFDRHAHADGIHGVYAALQRSFAQAIAAGKTVTLKPAKR